VEDCAELRMRLRDTTHDALAARVYEQAEEMQMALWKAVNLVRLGEVAPFTDKIAKRHKRQLAAMRIAA